MQSLLTVHSVLAMDVRHEWEFWTEGFVAKACGTAQLNDGAQKHSCHSFGVSQTNDVGFGGRRAGMHFGLNSPRLYCILTSMGQTRVAHTAAMASEPGALVSLL
jgi:hypothetical protein